MEISDYVTIVITVPESHADKIREVMGQAGAGEIGGYSFCSYSSKGIGRFKPGKGTFPFLGKEGILESLPEERIETVCHKEKLEQVLKSIKDAHPYEETVIEIYPIYEMGRKTSKA